MDTYLIVAIGVFLAGTFGARFINENALKLLSTEQKGALVEVFSSVRKKVLIIVAIVVGAFLLLLFYSGYEKSQLFFFYFGLLIALMLGTTVITRKTLIEHDFPKEYTNQYLLSSAVRYFGIGVFLIVMLMNNQFDF